MFVSLLAYDKARTRWYDMQEIWRLLLLEICRLTVVLVTVGWNIRFCAYQNCNPDVIWN